MTDDRYKAYKDFPAWKLTHRFVLDIYAVSNSFPRSETFGLTSQLRRAAMSISANIVEGIHRNSRKESIRFLNIARGSLAESDYFLLLAKDLRYITVKEYKKLYAQYDEIHFQLNSWLKSLKTKR